MAAIHTNSQVAQVLEMPQGLEPWYALYVRPKTEKVVQDLLRGKGYEVFLPTYLSLRRWSDRTVELQAPLFPSYVFTRLDIENRLPVLKTPGVMHVVGLGRVPLPLPEAEIEAVRKMVDSSTGVKPYPFLRKGQKVQIRTGPLAGAEGVLVRAKTGYRLVVSIDMLQRSVAAEVDLVDVRPV